MVKFQMVLFITLMAAISSVEAIDVCTNKWERIIETESQGGTFTNAKSLKDCFYLCEMNPLCLAMDFVDESAQPCRLHTKKEYLNGVVENTPSNQYRITRSCQTVDESALKCPSTWMLQPLKKLMSQSEATTHATATSCFNDCRFDPSCYAIVFNLQTWPPCYKYGQSSIQMPLALADDDDSITYIFNDKATCVAGTNPQTVGRCVGDKFPPSNQWCSGGTKPVLSGKFFKNHPLCCAGEYNSTPPLDSSSLPMFTVESMDSEYGKIIDNCVGAVNCSIAATALTKSYVSNPFCAEKTSTDFVSITYECLGISASSSPPPSVTSSTTNWNASIITPPLPPIPEPLTPPPGPIPPSSSSPPLSPSLPPPSSPTSPTPQNPLITTIQPPSNHTVPTILIFTTPFFSQQSFQPSSPILPSNPPSSFSPIPPSTASPTSPQVSQEATTPSTISPPSTTIFPPQIGEVQNGGGEAHTGLVLGAIGTFLGLLCLLALIAILVLVVYNTRKQANQPDNGDLVGKSHLPNTNYIGMSVV